MAKTANKKNIDNGMAYEFVIREKDVIERVDFGAFEVIKTSSGIMWKNYNGYHVFTKKYSTDNMGKAIEGSLYAWLDNLIETHKAFDGLMDEQFDGQTHDDGTPLTNREIYDMDRIVTEANLTKPLTIFTDLNEAIVAANEYISWLRERQEELLKAESEDLSSEDDVLRADVEEQERQELTETAVQIMDDFNNAEQR